MNMIVFWLTLIGGGLGLYLVLPLVNDIWILKFVVGLLAYFWVLISAAIAWKVAS